MAPMMYEVDVEDRDVVEVVREWMSADEARWKAWIP